MDKVASFYQLMQRAFLDLTRKGLTVHNALRVLDIKGTTTSCDCPIARYLRPIIQEWVEEMGYTLEEFEVFTHSADVVCKDSEGVRHHFTYHFAPAVMVFIHRFDHGEYPYLVAA